MSAASNRLEDFIAGLPTRMLGNHHTEIALGEPFVEMVSRFADEPGTIGLLSGSSLDSARYNVLGIRPWLTLREASGVVTADFAGKQLTCELDPFDMLDAVVKRYSLPGPEELAPLSSGLLGYLSYDLKDCLEVLPRTSCDDLRLPRLFMVAPSILVVEDRQRGTTTAHAPIFDDGLAGAKQRLAQFQAELARSSPPHRSGKARVGGLVSGMSREEYVDAVDAIRDYIVRGHVYQVNMSQRFETPFEGDAFALFQGMFEANPAPFFAFVQAGDHQIVSTSPERFIQLADGKVETRPIKGTRKRGKTPDEDKALRQELVTSTKDDAELSMIVDLLRNDIGKVCAAQSVRVSEHKRVEAYENVYHLVSVVVGQLDEGKNTVDLIRATFPGGSITGCPKIRSMEIIDELEPVRRHIYTGSIGYLGFRGTMDLSIAIRTATITDGRLVFSVGGGCVFDSNGPDEFDETLHKGRTVMRALEHTTTPAPVVLPAHERVGYWNGKFKRVSEIKLSVEDEGVSYGYGCFETLRVERGRVLRLDAHLARLRRAWAELFAVPFPDLTWRDVIEQVVARSHLGETTAAVKIMASAGKPGQSEPTLVVTARAYVHRLSGTGRTGLALRVYPHRRHSHLADHKTTNYMFQRLAGKWAQKQQADEALLLNADGSVSETNTGNVLCVMGGKLVRPLSEHVLPGTMEQAVCEVLAARGMPVEQRRVTVEELLRAESVIVTNALMGAVPVASVDGTRVADSGLCEGINEVVLAVD